MHPTKHMIAQVIDHTYLLTETEGISTQQQEDEIRQLVKEAHEDHAYSVCVRETMVPLAHKLIAELTSPLKLTTVIGFPEGDLFSTAKKIELAQQTLEAGAEDFDMVMRYRDFKSGHSDKVKQDISELSRFLGDRVLKVIVETAYLEESEKKPAFQLVLDALSESGAPLERRLIKTSTGFASCPPGTPTGATLQDVESMREICQCKIGIKAAGGVGSYDDAIAFFTAAGSPMAENNQAIDPFKFRIGSSSLLKKLK